MVRPGYGSIPTIPVADVIGSVLAAHEVSDLAIIEPELEGVIRQIYEERR